MIENWLTDWLLMWNDTLLKIILKMKGMEYPPAEIGVRGPPPENV